MLYYKIVFSWKYKHKIKKTFCSSHKPINKKGYYAKAILAKILACYTAAIVNNCALEHLRDHLKIKSHTHVEGDSLFYFMVQVVGKIVTLVIQRGQGSQIWSKTE